MSSRVVETHTADLFFVDGKVYKRKNPLDLGFCDFRTREARRAACPQEVPLNQRLPPQLAAARGHPGPATPGRAGRGPWPEATVLDTQRPPADTRTDMASLMGLMADPKLVPRRR